MDKHAVELEHPRDVGRENRAFIRDGVPDERRTLAAMLNDLETENVRLRKLVWDAAADLDWAGVEAARTKGDAHRLRGMAARLRAALGERHD